MAIIIQGEDYFFVLEERSMIFDEIGGRIEKILFEVIHLIIGLGFQAIGHGLLEVCL